MKKLFSIKNILIVFGIILIIVAGGYFYYQADQNSVAQIENWAEYQEIIDLADKFVGSGDCGSQEFDQFKQKAILGSMKKLSLAGNLDLILTPNYDHWTNNQFLDFLQDETAICAAGGRYPLRAFSDKLLWVGSCGSGVAPGAGVAYNNFIQCQKSAKMVSEYINGGRE
ncbi:MAG: hypothetical protein NTV81_00585 [Candidatus Komeilibacteria bacterium]|nr:hypothetical protein [Candidatus Komeilibacteria bacterium]